MATDPATPWATCFLVVWAVVVKMHGCPDEYEQKDTMPLHDGTVSNVCACQMAFSPDCLLVHVCGG